MPRPAGGTRCATVSPTGGKDGHPFPVNRQDYDRSISMLENALRRARTGDMENIKALKRLAAIAAGLKVT